MLNEESVKSLGFKGKYYHNLKNPSFTNLNHLWFKAQDRPQPYSAQKIHQLSFFKYGKTFGFETTRYIQYLDGLMYYYEGAKDPAYKGYCRLENVYMFYVELGTTNLLHLTNGAEYSQFFFKDHTFINNIPRAFFRQVIQVNFSQKYALLEMIGKGSFSKVYLGKNKSSQDKVAVKIVSKKDKHGAPTKQIVEEEKKILAMLDSDYICKMLQFFQEDDVFIFVLEFLPGVDLFKLFKQKKEFTLHSLRKIFKSILQGLMQAHAQNVIHRDIKPQNIIVDQSTYHTKLIDFGLSLWVNPNTSKKAYKRCGTMGYMAYEVIKNSSENRKVYDQKCDVFSFGIIAHMMLLQKNPLKGKTYEETAAKNSECNIKLDKDSILKKYGASCYDFLQGLLEIDPAKRWSAEQAYNCKFIKQMSLDTQTVLKTHAEDDYSPEKVRGSSYHNVEDDDFKIHKPKVESLVPKKVNF